LGEKPGSIGAGFRRILCVIIVPIMGFFFGHSSHIIPPSAVNGEKLICIAWNTLMVSLSIMLYMISRGFPFRSKPISRY